MTTKKQVEANRQNAKKSTGPGTEAGKARSARNALKHGLTAQQVVMLDEDPAAFEALLNDLYAHYQPADPIAEHLVEQVAVCIWRLRRVPEIEAGVYSHFAFARERVLAEKKVDAHVKYHDIYYRDEHSTIFDQKAHAAAKKDQERAEAQLQGDKPVLGEVFRDAEHTLTSLVRIAGAIEGSLYRTIRELEHIKAQQAAGTNGSPVIDVELEPEVPVQIERPRLKNRLAAKGDSGDTPK